ncbi:MAG: carboxypeptidase-like regulatory domain-containing protein, partial [Planctomycetota bacterium]
ETRGGRMTPNQLNAQIPSGRAATTAADGSFALPTKSKQTGTAHWIRADGPLAPIEWRQGAFVLDLGDVEVPEPRTIHGRVLDAAGNPVADAEVAASSTVDLGVRGAWPSHPGLATRTDADGRFTIAKLVRRSLRVCARKPGWQQHSEFAPDPGAVRAEAAADADDIVLTLRAGFALAGRIFSARGEPVAHANVHSYSQRPPLTQSDADGRFELRDMPKKVMLWIDGADHGGIDLVETDRTQSSSPAANAKPEELRIDLDRAYSLRVQTLLPDAVEQPVQVYVKSVEYRPGGRNKRYWPNWMRPRCATPFDVPPNGALELRGFAAAEYVLQAYAAGYGRSAPTTVVLPAPGSTAANGDADIELAIEPSAACRLRLVDARGNPIVGATVYWPTAILPKDVKQIAKSYASGGPRSVIAAVNGKMIARSEATTDADGSVPILHDNQQPLAFCIHAKGFDRRIEGFDPRAAPAQLELTLTGLAQVTGVLQRDWPGAIRRHLAFWPEQQDAAIRSGRGRPNRRVVVDKNGAFACNLPLGRWCCGVYGLSRATPRRILSGQGGTNIPLLDRALVPLAQRFEAVADRDTVLQLTEPPLGLLQGTIRFAGRPMAGVHISAIRPAAASVAPERRFPRDDRGRADGEPGSITGEDGRYRILYRKPGPVHLLVHRADMAEIMPDLTIDLPAPTVRTRKAPGRSPPPDRTFDIELPGGAVRGALRLDGLPQGMRASAKVHLYPWSLAGALPYTRDTIRWREASDADRRSARVPDEHGVFQFDFVPPGDWLVRVVVAVPGTRSAVTACDARVRVANGAVHVGELAPTWNGPVQIGMQVENVLHKPSALTLHRIGSRADPVWIARHRFRNIDASLRYAATLPHLPAGQYRVTPEIPEFARPGRERVPMQPFEIRVATDGSVTPATVRLQPKQ